MFHPGKVQKYEDIQAECRRMLETVSIHERIKTACCNLVQCVFLEWKNCPCFSQRQYKVEISPQNHDK